VRECGFKEKRNTHKDLVTKSEKRDHFGARARWEDNIKVNVKHMHDREWIRLIWLKIAIN
jgi:hypothetical protein